MYQMVFNQDQDMFLLTEPNKGPAEEWQSGNVKRPAKFLKNNLLSHGLALMGLKGRDIDEWKGRAILWVEALHRRPINVVEGSAENFVSLDKRLNALL
jgi:hypothetical protein